MDMKTYMAWWSAKRRCTNPTDPAYINYGKRGIKMLWDSYEDFVHDMGYSPKGYWLDRINNDGNYEYGNCRWVNPQESARNRRNNNVITVRGISLTIAEWAERIGITHRTLWMRLYRGGWSPEEAVGIIPRKKKKKTH